MRRVRFRVTEHLLKLTHVSTTVGRDPETRISTTVSFTFDPLTWFDAYFHILNYKLRLLGPLNTAWLKLTIRPKRRP